MKTVAPLATGILLLGLTGCAALNPPSPPAATAGIPVNATVSPPAPAETSTHIAPPPATPNSAYRNPRIGVVYLRAYQDAAGRLFGPQVMYQIAEPGGWNLDAVEHDRMLSDTNFETPPWSPVIGPAKSAPEPPSNSPLLDPATAAQIILTGLMRQEDQGQAEAMARQAGDRVAMFDVEAGWLLMPAKPANKP